MRFCPTTVVVALSSAIFLGNMPSVVQAQAPAVNATADLNLGEIKNPVQVFHLKSASNGLCAQASAGPLKFATCDAKDLNQLFSYDSAESQINLVTDRSQCITSTDAHVAEVGPCSNHPRGLDYSRFDPNTPHLEVKNMHQCIRPQDLGGLGMVGVLEDCRNGGNYNFLREAFQSPAAPQTSSNAAPAAPQTTPAAAPATPQTTPVAAPLATYNLTTAKKQISMTDMGGKGKDFAEDMGIYCRANFGQSAVPVDWNRDIKSLPDNQSDPTLLAIRDQVDQQPAIILSGENAFVLTANALNLVVEGYPTSGIPVVTMELPTQQAQAFNMLCKVPVKTTITPQVSHDPSTLVSIHLPTTPNASIAIKFTVSSRLTFNIEKDLTSPDLIVKMIDNCKTYFGPNAYPLDWERDIKSLSSDPNDPAVMAVKHSISSSTGLITWGAHQAALLYTSNYDRELQQSQDIKPIEHYPLPVTPNSFTLGAGDVKSWKSQTKQFTVFCKAPFYDTSMHFLPVPDYTTGSVDAQRGYSVKWSRDEIEALPGVNYPQLITRMNDWCEQRYGPGAKPLDYTEDIIKPSVHNNTLCTLQQDPAFLATYQEMGNHLGLITKGSSVEAAWTSHGWQSKEFHHENLLTVDSYPRREQKNCDDLVKKHLDPREFIYGIWQQTKMSVFCKVPYTPPAAPAPLQPILTPQQLQFEIRQLGYSIEATPTTIHVNATAFTEKDYMDGIIASMDKKCHEEFGQIARPLDWDKDLSHIAIAPKDPNSLPLEHRFDFTPQFLALWQQMTKNYGWIMSSSQAWVANGGSSDSRDKASIAPLDSDYKFLTAATKPPYNAVSRNAYSRTISELIPTRDGDYPVYCRVPARRSRTAPANGKQGPSVFGDPHVKLWDGTKFDFHGGCDLVLVDSPSFADGLGLTVHIRTKIETWWSFIESAVIRIGNQTLEFKGGPDHNGGFSFWSNGLPGSIVNVEDDEGLKAFKQNIMNVIPEFKLVFRAPSPIKHKFRLGFGSGNGIVFDIYKSFLGVSFQYKSEKLFEGSKGLMGSYPDGKMVARDGVTDMSANTDEFGMEWQVRIDEPMLFHEIDGVQHPQKCAMPVEMKAEDKRKKRRRLGEALITEEDASIACAHAEEENRDACIFDVLATNDKDMAGAY